MGDLTVPEIESRQQQFGPALALTWQPEQAKQVFNVGHTCGFLQGWVRALEILTAMIGNGSDPTFTAYALMNMGAHIRNETGSEIASRSELAEP